jgi:hypothetical protein
MKDKNSNNSNILSRIEPRGGLREAILDRIEMAERQRALYKIVFCSVTMPLSLVGFATAVYYTYTACVSSGFFSYLALAFSDGRALTSAFGDFILSIVETVPLLQITALFGALFVVISLSKMAVIAVSDILHINHSVKNYGY